MYCWELLRHDRALGRDGGMRCWSILAGLSLGVHELPRRSVSSERSLDKLHELFCRHLPRHDRSDYVGDLCSLHCRNLLWHDRTLGGNCGMRQRAVFCGLGLGMYQLPRGSVSSKRRFHELHELPHGLLPRHDRSDVAGDVCSLHCRKLLRHDWALSRHGSLRRWAVLPSFGLVLHELLGGSISSKCCVDWLHELPHGHLPRQYRRVVVVVLCSLHFRQLLRHDRSLGRYGHLRCWKVLGGLGLSVHELRRGSVSS